MCQGSVPQVPLKWLFAHVNALWASLGFWVLQVQAQLPGKPSSFNPMDCSIFQLKKWDGNLYFRTFICLVILMFIATKKLLE